MRKTLYALALGLAINATAHSQTTYTVRSGDNLATIAKRFGLEQLQILRANPGVDSRRLQIGQKLRIPQSSAASKSAKTSAVSSSKGSYAVRSGDNDDKIAKRAGLTVAKLHALNPGVKWTRLQVGQKLKISGTPGGSANTVAKIPSQAKSYVVRRGDNDWVIAKRVGTTPSALRSKNPGVNWGRLQIGQKLLLPSSAKVASTSPKTSKPQSSGYAVLTRDGVFVRSTPSTKGRVLKKASSGTRATIVAKSSDWYKLKFSSGTVGWVRSDMLKRTSGSVAQTTRNPRSIASSKPAAKVAYHAATGNAIVDKALTLLGTRYRYGAMSRSATDCSGFTSQVYRTFGVKLPRTSREQAKVGVGVSKSQLKPGDLVFFRTLRSRRINHVGIYKGNGTFVHASSGKGSVRVDSLNDGYYRDRYVTARRVSGAKPSKVANVSKPAENSIAETTVVAEDWDKPFQKAPNPGPASGER